MSAPSYNTLDDFLKQDSFREWVTGHRPQDRIFWQNWLEQNPDKRELYEQAAALCVVLQGQSRKASREQIQQATGKIKQSIAHSRAFEVRKQTEKRIGYRWLWTTTGIAALLALGFFFRDYLTLGTKQPSLAAAEERIAEEKESWKKIINLGKQSQLVDLPDGSSVLLGQGGQLWYNTKSKKREVYLQGEGFFEVVKDPKRPFLVYTSLLTTRVLGTSFEVQASQKDRMAFVKVKTGKVTVHSTKNPSRSIILALNEQAKLDTKTDKLTKQFIHLTKQNSTPILAENLNFEFTPVTDILDKLSKSYHTSIEFDRKKLHGCTFNGDLTGLPFTEKINLICLAIEASYEKIGEQITIKGRGCTP